MNRLLLSVLLLCSLVSAQAGWSPTNDPLIFFDKDSLTRQGKYATFRLKNDIIGNGYMIATILMDCENIAVTYQKYTIYDRKGRPLSQGGSDGVWTPIIGDPEAADAVRGLCLLAGQVN